MNPTQQSLNWNSFASSVSSQQLLDKFDFVSIKSGNKTITAADSAFAGGGTTALQTPGGVKFFQTPSNTGAQGSVSVKGFGQNVSLSSSPTGALAPQATATAAGAQATASGKVSDTTLYVIGGAIALIALTFILLRS